ncbi:sulfurtransferase TusA family protein [Thalassococcus sp. CAU 1522]|uniref:Sulfurtransferase TusA family protein n=1 Tax=Thalassococcus arenae TaxID=2851652 RepID=A0ABS6N9M1_9RHOB|nr:sulfurtransferase TusA family protein [Thalassococcus arenae]MBV2360694.1 sulfurtransferase TusA family protein [Thalassococcus arenae]
MNDVLDATGLLCPLPVLKARKRLMALPEGGVLVLQTDDPAAIVDVPHFCAEAGHSLEDSREDGLVTTWTIRKAGRTA